MLRNRKKITDFVKEAYRAYFGINIGDQDKNWAPKVVCRSCIDSLSKWKNGIKKHLKFGIPMVWREPKNHHDDCYFCAIDTLGFNRLKSKTFQYPNLQSASRPVQHNDEIPVPILVEKSFQTLVFFMIKYEIIYIFESC